MLIKLAAAFLMASVFVLEPNLTFSQPEICATDESVRELPNQEPPLLVRMLQTPNIGLPEDKLDNVVIPVKGDDCPNSVGYCPDHLPQCVACGSTFPGVICAVRNSFCCEGQACGPMHNCVVCTGGRQCLPLGQPCR